MRARHGRAVPATAAPSIGSPEAAGSGEQRPARVDGRLAGELAELTRAARARRIPVDDDQHIGDVGVGNVGARRQRRPPPRHRATLPGRSSTRRADERRLGNRPRSRRATELFEHQDRVELGQPEAARVFRHQQAEDPRLCQRLPDLPAAARSLGAARAHLGRQLRGQDLAYRPGQLSLIGGESETHQAPLGSRRTRSATTLRWISFVPA